MVPIDSLGVQSEDKILATYYNIEICAGKPSPGSVGFIDLTKIDNYY